LDYEVSNGLPGNRSQSHHVAHLDEAISVAKEGKL